MNQVECIANQKPLSKENIKIMQRIFFSCIHFIIYKSNVVIRYTFGRMVKSKITYWHNKSKSFGLKWDIIVK